MVRVSSCAKDPVGKIRVGVSVCAKLLDLVLEVSIGRARVRLGVHTPDRVRRHMTLPIGTTED